jgi:hypothetical protein
VKSSYSSLLGRRFFVTTPLVRRLAALCCALLFSIPVSAAAQDVLRPLTAEQEARYRASRGGDGAPAARAAVAGVPDGVLTAELDEDSRQFIVPRFRVDATSAAGTTTLFAVRNTRSTPVSVLVSYFDDFGMLQEEETFDLDGFEILTRNVRDVPGLSSAGGFKTGFIIITGPTGSLLSADVFQVDPGNDFATGSRAVDVIATYLCDLWDIRFLAGGIFSGGTSVNLLINSPQGNDRATDDPSAVFAISDEAGNPLGLIGLYTNRVSTTVPAEDILDAIGPGAPAFGAFEVDFTDADGGSLDAVFDADGRFSIGLKGACLEPGRPSRR